MVGMPILAGIAGIKSPLGIAALRPTAIVVLAWLYVVHGYHLCCVVWDATQERAELVCCLAEQAYGHLALV
jgi:hypothetical protein